MRERALEIVAARPEGTSGRNVLREYLQSRILGAMQERGSFVPLAFMGGTALRFLYRIHRFSEDLDFTVERQAEEFDFEGLTAAIGRVLTSEGYAMRTTINRSDTVRKAQIGFVGLLAEAGISPHADEVLSVKLEADTNPPAGAGLAVSMIDRFGPLRLQHHDIPSLFAGKIAAVLARDYTKGRDLYDLMWYLSRTPGVEPNLELLRNALAQTAPQLAAVAHADWRTATRERLGRVDWVDARRDLAPFLEQPRDTDLIEPATFAQLLG